MKKFGKVVKKMLIGLLVVLVVFFTGTFIFGRVTLNNNKAKIEPYGQKVDVMGKQMNVYIKGNGEETIVMIPGYGTPSPTLDFAPLIDELSGKYRVVVLEPFGYGLSDETDRERTPANMIEEYHEAIKALGIDKFVFMGHSIGGIYILNYVNTYPGEVTAFIGVDTSVPDQPSTSLPSGLFKFAKKSGILSLVQEFYMESGAPATVWEGQKENYDLIADVNAFNDTTMNELGNLTNIFESSRGLKLPADLPVYLFVQEHNTGVERWTEMHQAQMAEGKNGKMLLIDADHYLHHTESKLIASETIKYLESLKQ